MVTYPVERMDEVTVQMLMDMGFSSELQEYLTSQNVSKDEVVSAMESVEDKGLKLDALIGSIVMARSAVTQAPEEAAPVVSEEQKSPVSEVTAE